MYLFNAVCVIRFYEDIRCLTHGRSLHMYAYACMFICIRVRMCMHVCKYMYVYIYIYVYRENYQAPLGDEWSLMLSMGRVSPRLPGRRRTWGNPWAALGGMRGPGGPREGQGASGWGNWKTQKLKNAFFEFLFFKLFFNFVGDLKIAMLYKDL